MTDTAVVRVQRIMPAAPEDVFDEWLDPDALGEWMCPRPVRCVAVDVEPHVGGALRLDLDDHGASVLITGRFLAIDRPRLLRFTWTSSDWPDPTTASTVEVSFAPAADGATLMSIEHAVLPGGEYDNYHSGWAATVDQLAALLPR